MRPIFSALLTLLVGCSTVGVDDSPIELLQPTDAKSDGAAEVTLPITLAWPSRALFFQCGEFFSCDADVTVTLRAPLIEQRLSEQTFTERRKISKSGPLLLATVNGVARTVQIEAVVGRGPNPVDVHSSISFALRKLKADARVDITLERETSTQDVLVHYADGVDRPLTLVPDDFEVSVTASWH